MRGFLLGLANGTICLAYCAPVLVPYLLGEGQTIRRNYLDLSRFLIGRLFGYLLFAILAWSLNLFILQHNGYRDLILGVSYVLLAVLLVYYCFRKAKGLCAAEYVNRRLPGFVTNNRILLPLSLGFLTGLNLCPPFLLAFTSAVAGGSLGNSLLFFSAFFLGTSLFFIPLPVLGIFTRKEVVRTVGKFAAGVIGCYYLYMGILILIGGMQKL
jgi:sulfite exporter TauE/SafE